MKVPDAPLMYSTDHLDVYVDGSMMLCAGSADEYELAYRYFVDKLELAPPLGIRLYVSGDATTYCSKRVRGCRKNDGTIVSDFGSIHHELGHAANCEWRNDSAPALAEGLATAFEVTPLTTKMDPREFITAADLTVQGYDSAGYYDAAGHFVRWLLEEHDLEAFREAFEHAPREGGEEVLEVLAAAYDQPADELFEAYMASAPHMWVPYRQCADLELLEPEADVWEFHTTFDCADPSTLGPYERTGTEIDLAAIYRATMYQSFLIEVDTPGMYRFERDEFRTWIEIERCVEQPGLTEAEVEQLWHREELFPTVQGITDVELRAGTYRVDVRRRHAEPHPVWVRIAPNPG